MAHKIKFIRKPHLIVPEDTTKPRRLVANIVVTGVVDPAKISEIRASSNEGNFVATRVDCKVTPAQMPTGLSLIKVIMREVNLKARIAPVDNDEDRFRAVISAVTDFTFTIDIDNSSDNQANVGVPEIGIDPCDLG